MNRILRKFSGLLVFSLFSLAPSGCMGPTAMRATRGQYNEAIRVTSAEQMLRNLVRLRYGQSIVFLNVTSVSTQFSLDHSASISGILNENVGFEGKNPNSLGLGASASFSERPTITYQPLTGEDFATRMLAPIGLDVAVMMTAAGWGPERVFQTITYQINGLENPIGPRELTPDLKDDSGDFARMTRLLGRIRKARMISLGVKRKLVPMSGPIPARDVTTSQLLDAAREGRLLVLSDDGQTYTLVDERHVPVIDIPPDVRDHPDIKEFMELLDLNPTLDHYELSSTLIGLPEPSSPGQRDQIRIATRSLLTILVSFAEAIEAPASHQAAGVVGPSSILGDTLVAREQYARNLLHIRSSPNQPKNAVVAIRHRGYWFYIADDDPSSKATFNLLNALFDLLGGQTASAQAPVLTLPVG